MKSKLIILVIILGISAGFFGYQKFSYNNKTYEKNLSNKSTNISWLQGGNLNEDTKKEILDWATLDSAVSNMSIEECEKISDSKLMSQCLDLVYATKAKFSNDPTICENIKDTKIKNECKKAFELDRLVNSWSLSDCQKISWNDFAKTQCITNAVFKEISSDSFSWTIDICNNLSDNNKTQCIKLIEWQKNVSIANNAVEKKDMNLCNSITDANEKNNCIESIKLANTLWTTDLSSCNSLTDSLNKQTCIETVKRNIDAEAFQESATSTNISSCNTISDSTTKEKCVTWISIKNAVNNKDIKACSNISDDTERQKCENTVKALLSVK